mgnify:FL=1
MKNRIITISREFGSGGRTVGKELSRRLDIPYYDAEIIQMTAAESGMTQEYIRLQDEMTPHANPLVNSFQARDQYGMTLQDHLWQIQRKVIFDLANRSDCIIIGRCADYLLFHLHHCLRVFIHGDFDDRMERILKVYGESAESPKKRLLDKDFRRKAYYEFYTEQKWGDPKNYDIMLNSGSLGIDQCIDILASIWNNNKEADEI